MTSISLARTRSKSPKVSLRVRARERPKITPNLIPLSLTYVVVQNKTIIFAVEIQILLPSQKRCRHKLAMRDTSE